MRRRVGQCTDNFTDSSVPGLCGSSGLSQAESAPFYQVPQTYLTSISQQLCPGDRGPQKLEHSSLWPREKPLVPLVEEAKRPRAQRSMP